MGGIFGSRRVLFALVFSLILIGGSYYLAHSVTSPPVAQASEETALLQALATKDSTGDGLPDWEKTLYGIPLDATTTDYFHLGMTDGEAVAKGLIVPKAIADIAPATTTSSAQVIAPGAPAAPADDTLTAAFAKNFFTLYVSAKEANGGADLSDTDLQNIANEALSSLESSVSSAPDFKTASDLTVSGSGAAALTVFAAAAEAVMVANTADATTSEINYLEDAVEGNDPNALTHIDSIAKAYRNTAVGLSALPVPQELATDDLSLINSLARISEIAEDFTRVNNDPLAAILALNQYPDAVTSLTSSLQSIVQVYTTASVTLSPRMPGYAFINILSGTPAASTPISP